MSYSDQERKILINQFLILKTLDPKNSEKYDQDIEILSDGYEVYYESVGYELLPTLSLDVSKEVFDTLTVFQVIDNHIRENPADQEVTKHYNAKFQGYDGNNETDHYRFVEFVINTQKKYKALFGQTPNVDLNSHSEMREKYKAMVDTYRRLHKFKNTAMEFTKEEILEILNAEY